MRAKPENSVFFCCDIQSSCSGYMLNYPTMAKNGARLAQTAQLLEIPVLATSHIKFGPIDEMITAKHHPGVTVFEDKRRFSMIDERVEAYLASLGEHRRQAILYGCEAHICIK